MKNEELGRAEDGKKDAESSAVEVLRAENKQLLKLLDIAVAAMKAATSSANGSTVPTPKSEPKPGLSGSFMLELDEGELTVLWGILQAYQVRHVPGEKYADVDGAVKSMTDKVDRLLEGK